MHANNVNDTQNKFGNRRAILFRIFEYHYVQPPTVALPRFSPTTPSHWKALSATGLEEPQRRHPAEEHKVLSDDEAL